MEISSCQIQAGSSYGPSNMDQSGLVHCDGLGEYVTEIGY